MNCIQCTDSQDKTFFCRIVWAFYSWYLLHETCRQVGPQQQLKKKKKNLYSCKAPLVLKIMIQNFFVQKLMIHNFLVQKSNNLLLLITINFLAFFLAFCIFIYVYGKVSIESAVSGTLDNDIFDYCMSKLLNNIQFKYNLKKKITFGYKYF